ncbi:CBM_collapsed_G0020730.mRNA.1.CDS.1 [Saccharomyces cerevisiae]|nr:CBM_collapsed_G0020730.mRNA.1.CDS.1 [Saccharomyces cerevisiae]
MHHLVQFGFYSLFVTLVVGFVMAFRNAAKSRQELQIQNLEVPERIPEVFKATSKLPIQVNGAKQSLRICTLSTETMCFMFVMCSKVIIC